MTTTGILRANEECHQFQAGRRGFLFFALTFEIKINGEKEAGSVEKSDDKEEFGMVIKRMAGKVRMGCTPLYRMEDEAHKTNGNGRRLVESGTKFPAWLKNWGRC